MSYNVENDINIMISESDLCHYAKVMSYSLKIENIIWLNLHNGLMPRLVVSSHGLFITIPFMCLWLPSSLGYIEFVRI